MKNVLGIAAALLVSLSARAAHADGDGPLAWVYAATQLTALGCGVYDVVGTPRSTEYAVVEIGTGVASGAYAQYAASNLSDSGGAPLFGLLAVADQAVASHGVWLLTRDEPPPTEVSIGRARGRVAPTVVSDGHTMLPAMGIVGTF